MNIKSIMCVLVAVGLVAIPGCAAKSGGEVVELPCRADEHRGRLVSIRLSEEAAADHSRVEAIAVLREPTPHGVIERPAEVKFAAIDVAMVFCAPDVKAVKIYGF